MAEGGAGIRIGIEKTKACLLLLIQIQELTFWSWTVCPTLQAVMCPNGSHTGGGESIWDGTGLVQAGRFGGQGD